MKVDGLLLLDKPLGLSSNAALQRARRFCDAARAGHGGTLDPLASGLLPVMFGEACKLAEASLAGDKGYLATVRLGVRTSTDDAEGESIEVRDPTIDGMPIERASIEAVLERFRGEIVQVPPVFSALKIGGVPSYKRARRGEVLEAPAPRRVVIHELVVEDWSSPDLRIRVLCSKGTYIRALARDVGEALGCGAHLAALRRTRVGRFDVRDAIGLDALGALEPAARLAKLIGLESLVEGWPAIELAPDAAARFVHGQVVPIADPPASVVSLLGLPGEVAPAQRIAVFGSGRLIGLARAQSAGEASPAPDPLFDPSFSPQARTTCLLAPSRIITP